MVMGDLQQVFSGSEGQLTLPRSSMIRWRRRQKTVPSHRPMISVTDLG